MSAAAVKEASVGGNCKVLDGVLKDRKSLSTTRLVEAEADDGEDEDDEQGGKAVHHPLRHVVFVHEGRLSLFRFFFSNIATLFPVARSRAVA